MNDNNGTTITLLGSLLVALLIGTVAGTMLWVFGGWSFLQGAFVGSLVFAITGGVIGWAMTRPLPAPNELELTVAELPKKTAPTARSVKAAPVAAAPAPTVARKAAKPAAKPAPKKEAPKKEAPKKAAAKKADPAPQAAASDDGARPALLIDAPKGGTADDLQKISGVGPKLEQTLNELGVWHYEQVAKFTKDDIAWVDERLRFKGRIERDDWMSQAKALAEGKA